MATTKITLFGIEDYLNYFNQSVFDNISLPTQIDKETLINTIMLRCGEFDLLYPDSVFMSSAVQSWFKRYNRTFTKWVNAANSNYDIFENVDYHEAIHEVKNNTHGGTRTTDGTITHTGTVETDNTTTNTGTVDTDNTTKNTGTVSTDGTVADDRDTTTTTSTSAFNSSTWQNKDKEVVDDGNTRTTHMTDTNNLTEVLDGTVTNNLTEVLDGKVTNNLSEDNDTTITDDYSARDEITRTLDRYGKGDKYSYQELLKQEFEVSLLNVYNAIADLFVVDFCVCTY